MQDEVTQADREAAWPYAGFHCLPDRQMHERWFSGYYDNLGQGQAIRDFARHRHQAERDTLARMEWRDAAKDAAPKDGTRILVRNDRGTFTVEWDEDCIDGWWVCPDGKHDDRPLRGGEPTHWMPLPPAPEAGQ